MRKGRLFLWGVLGGIILVSCKHRTEEGQPGGREKVSIVPEKESGSLLGRFILPDDAAMDLPDTETEKRLRKSGLVSMAEIDPSIEVCLMYATTENFTRQLLYGDLQKAFLLPETARRLADAQCLLKTIRPHWSLIIYDAVRPMSVQQVMWDKVKGTDHQVYVSNPARGGGLHNYGAAVDVSLIDSMGQGVEMGSSVDYFGDEARPDREEILWKQGRITLPALENRRLLRRVMQEAGFRPLHSEWWHFNMMSREEAKKKLKVIP